MATKMLIDATHAEETRVVVVDGNKVEEFDFETVNRRQLAGNIYLAKITRVEPSLQAAFVDYGGNRHGFLAFSEIHPDYYQIPVADRQALLAEERAYAEEMDAEENSRARRRAPRPERKAESRDGGDATRSSDDIPGMGVIDMGDDEDMHAPTNLGDGRAEADGAADSHAHDSHDDHDHHHDHAGQPDDSGAENGNGNGNGDEPYVAADHASESDPEIESVAEEDVAEEIRQPRRPRARRYKIQEVVKVRQIMLVQVVKEERGNKGAALTTYLSLAGRYCVLMPNTARGGGISRKITNAVDRKKLKEIAGEMLVPEGAGLIIRTAGSQRTKSEIKRDYEYLMRLWEQVRDLTMKSIAPAPIYEEGDLIKRTIRDLYSKEIDEVLVEGAAGYRAAKDFMTMIMPSHARNVKLYNEPQPLFARFQVESYLGGMFNPTVQLKSGGYIVIGVTEALVAIDVNSGRATKEGSIEETALKTNLEAAEEVARQLRLRDLAGLIVIDFIDMEERRNNASVEKRLKEKLKTDRARIQVGRISGFGLLEMSRQRLRPGMLESTTQPCAHCHGTGIIRSDDSLSLSILRQIEEEGTRKRSREVLLKAPVAVVNFLMNQKREHVAGIELRYGLSVRIEADPSLISPDFTLEKFKIATRVVPEVTSAVVSVNTTIMDDLVDEDQAVDLDEDEDEDEPEARSSAPSSPRGEGDAEGDPSRRKKRRRRRRRKGGPREEGEAMGQEAGSDADDADGAVEDAGDGAVDTAAEATSDAPRKRRSRGGRGRKSGSRSADVPTDGAVNGDASEADVSKAGDGAAEASAVTSAEAGAVATAELSAPEASAAPDEGAAKPKPRRSPRKKPAAEAAGDVAAEGQAAAPAPDADAPVTKPKAVRSRAKKPAAEAAPEATPAPAEAAAAVVAASAPVVSPEPVAAGVVTELLPEAMVATAEPEAAADKPKKRGWWSSGR